MISPTSRPGNHRSGRRFGLLFAGVLGVALTATTWTVFARPTQPNAQDRQITFAVAALMEKGHLTGHRLDDEISARCMDTFIKELDPLKLFFYESDVEEFKSNRKQLDDLFRRGDITFAYKVFSRFLSRVDEHINVALAELDKPKDFSVDEEMISDPDASTYAKTPEEAADRWRKRVKFDLLKEIADEVKMEDAVAKLRKRYDSIRKSWHQTDNDELLERYLSAMTTGYDPHSSYMSASTLDNFNITMKLELDGIGASLRAVDGYTEVQEVIPGGAADRDGRLKKGDRITGVGEGKNGPIEDVVDLKLNDVVKKIRGKRDTIVRLEVIPVETPNERKTYELTRARIELKSQEARSDVIEHGKKADGTPYRIGVIQLPSFYMDMDGARLGMPDYKSTTRDVRRLLEAFKSQNIDAVVVDLRWNGGGSLTEAVNMTGLFIDSGPVVQVKGPDGSAQTYKDQEPGMAWEGPLVVMINKFSASASEIFAGAIQDYGRGIVIGDHATHGKGTVQQLYDLGNALFRIGENRNMGALKLTIQQFYRPGGDSTQNRGVVSDVELPSLTTQLDVGEGDLDFALEFDRVEPLPHDQYRMIDKDILQGLRSRSQQRVTKDDFFSREARRIARYQEQKERKAVTLNKEKFLAEREELNADKEEEQIYEGLMDPDRPVFERDGYGDEALNITVDYLDLLGGNKVAIAHPGTAARSSTVVNSESYTQ